MVEQGNSRLQAHGHAGPVDLGQKVVREVAALVREHHALDQLQPIVDEKGCTLAQLALAWCAQQPGVTSPIIGPRTIEQLEDNLAAAEIELSAEELETLAGVSQLPLEYPGWMLAFHAADRTGQAQ